MRGLQLGGLGLTLGTASSAAVARVSYLDDGGASAGLWYGANSNPAWVYDAPTNRVLGVIQRYNYNGGTVLKENTFFSYDLSTNVAALGNVIMTDDSVTVGTADQHGVGVLCKDQYGFWHSYGGAHSLPMKTSVSIDGGATWTAKGTLGTAMTYPHPVQIGNTQYVFMRESPGGATYPLVLYKSSAISASTGAISWNAKITIIDMENDTRVYAGTLVAVGSLIYIPWTRANAADSIRLDLYLGVYDTTTDTFRNLAGTASVSGAGFPLLRTVADASFRLVDQTTAGIEESNSPSIFIDAEGIHCLYQGGASGLIFYYARYSLAGALLEGPTNLGAAPYRYSTPAIGPLPGGAGGVEVLFPSLVGAVNDMETQAAFVRGGNIYRTTRPAGGSWSAATLIMATTPVHPLDGVTRVEGAPANFRFAFCERAIDDADFSTGGNLRSFGWGSGGMVTTPFVEDVDAAAYIGGAAYSDADRQIVTTYFRGIKQVGWWLKGDFAYLMGEPVEAVARKNVFEAVNSGTSLTDTAAGVTHTPYLGLDGTASAKLTALFNPSTSVTKRMTTTSIQLCIVPTENVTAPSSDLGTTATTAALTLSAQSTSNNVSTLLADGTSLSKAVGSATFLLMSQRAGTTKSIYVRSKTSPTNSTVTATGFPNGNLTLLGNSTGFSQRRLGYAHGGVQLDAGPIIQVVKRYMYERLGVVT
jgi:hypothetical protein